MTSMEEESSSLLDVSLAEITFVYFDVETTGLKPQFGDRICEVAALRCKGGEELRAYHTLVNPQRPISPGAFRVNLISEEDLEHAPLFEDVADDLLDALSDGVMVAHNARFDLGFLAAELATVHYPMIDTLVVDTLTLARRYYSFPSNSLSSVARSLGFGTEQLHRALSDVRLTRQVLETFMNDLRPQGVHTLGHLLGAQGGIIPIPTVRQVPLPPAIEEALAQEGNLYIRYVSAKGEETERIVKPLRVTSLRDYVYLVAYCHMREARRVFRLDRILEMGPLHQP